MELKLLLGLELDEICIDLEVLRAMAKAGIPQSLAYAYCRTGMILTGENRHLFSTKDLQDWADALDEYRKYAEGTDENSTPFLLLAEGL